MTKKQYSKICTLYKVGISSELCVSMIISLHSAGAHSESAKWIDSFYHDIVIPTNLLIKTEIVR